MSTTPAQETAPDDEYPQTEVFYQTGEKPLRWLGFPEVSWNLRRMGSQLWAMMEMAQTTDVKYVSLHDARKEKVEYEKVGFSIEALQSEVTDWNGASLADTPENLLYRSELEKLIRKLHPNVVKIEWSSFLLRGGPNEDAPASGAVHLDYFPNKEKMVEYLATHKNGYHDFMLNQFKHPDLELGMVLGIWKPRNMDGSSVYDTPLMLCDPSTVNFDDSVCQEQEFSVNAEGKKVNIVNLAANLKYSSEHKWYYYPEQTEHEVIIFRQFTPKTTSFANYHCAAKLPLPEGKQKRRSVETRAFLFFEKSK